MLNSEILDLVDSWDEDSLAWLHVSFADTLDCCLAVAVYDGNVKLFFGRGVQQDWRPDYTTKDF